MGALGILLKSLGINIDPKQVENDYAKLKSDVATWGQMVLQLKEAQDIILAQNTEILQLLKKENPDAVG